MKGKKMKMGGSLNDKTKERAMEPEKALEMKRGGKAKKKSKHMGKVHGKKSGKRLDKFKRGGKVGTPSSPLSGAGNISERSGFSSTTSTDKEQD